MNEWNEFKDAVSSFIEDLREKPATILAVGVMGLGAGLFLGRLGVSPKAPELPCIKCSAVATDAAPRVQLGAATPGTESILSALLLQDSVRRPVEVVIVDRRTTWTSYGGGGNSKSIATGEALIQASDEGKLTDRLVVNSVTTSKPDAESIKVAIQNQPGVVVVHRSAFGEADDEKLVRFLKTVLESAPAQKAPPPVIVFSRQPDTTPEWVRSLRSAANYTGEVFAYNFREGEPFKDPQNPTDFLQFVIGIGQAERARLEQNLYLANRTR